MSGSKDNIYKAEKAPETSKIHKAASPQFYKAKQFLGRKTPTNFQGALGTQLSLIVTHTVWSLHRDELFMLISYWFTKFIFAGIFSKYPVSDE